MSKVRFILQLDQHVTYTGGRVLYHLLRSAPIACFPNKKREWPKKDKLKFIEELYKQLVVSDRNFRKSNLTIVREHANIGRAFSYYRSVLSSLGLPNQHAKKKKKTLKVALKPSDLYGANHFAPPALKPVEVAGGLFNAAPQQVVMTPNGIQWVTAIHI